MRIRFVNGFERCEAMSEKAQDPTWIARLEEMAKRGAEVAAEMNRPEVAGWPTAMPIKNPSTKNLAPTNKQATVILVNAGRGSRRSSSSMIGPCP